MKRRFIALLIIFAGAVSLFAASPGYSVRSQHFLPPQYYVGDPVELRIRVIMDGDLELQPPAVLPDPDWVDIRSVEVFPGKGEAEIRINFVSFQPGLRTLPSMNLGDLVLEGAMVQTESLVSEGYKELIPFVSQMTLPGTRILGSLILGGLFIGPLVLILIIQAVRHQWFGNPDRRRRSRSHRLFIKGMRELSSKVGVLSSRELYTRLLDLFRTYLTDRTGADFLTVTSREMTGLMRKTLPREAFTKELRWGDLRTLMDSGDGIKFGGKIVSKERQKRDISTIHQVVASVERAYKLQDDAKGRKKR